MLVGQHSFYKVEEFDETNCSEMRPVFLLYSKADDELHGYGLNVPGTVLDKRFENPELAAIEAVMGETPDCIRNISRTSEIHLLFEDMRHFMRLLYFVFFVSSGN